MSKHLRDALREIARAGGRNPIVTNGGRHTIIRFTAIDGSPKQVVLSRGTVVKTYAIRRMRSQVRNQPGGNRWG